MYKSIMWSYIKEEQELLMSLLKDEEVKQKIEKLSSVEALYIVAHGSSYNAASAIALVISRLARIRVYVYMPSQILHGENPLLYEDKNSVYVCGISQTGTSRSVLEALQKIKDKGFSVLGITNEAGSPIEEMSDVTLHLKCQEEKSNAKTKGYSATLLVLCKVAIELAKIKGNLDSSVAEKIHINLAAEICEINTTAEKVWKWCDANDYGAGMSHVYVIGNGVNAATAMEGQLKLMETVCIPTMYSNIEEFSHGMHRSVMENSHMILINTKEGEFLTSKTFEYFDSQKVLMLDMISNVENENIIKIPLFEDTDSVFLTTVAIQVISVFVPEKKGMDPNRCANDDYTQCVGTRVDEEKRLKRWY